MKFQFKDYRNWRQKTVTEYKKYYLDKLPSLNFLLLFQPSLLVIYFVLVRYNVNIDELSSVDLFSVFLVFLPTIIFFSFIPRLLIKNLTKYILILSSLVVLFFSYTSIHGFLYEYSAFGYSIGSHKILIPLLLILVILEIYFLIKSNKQFDKILIILTGFVFSLIIFVAIDVVMISNIEPLSEYNSEQVFSFDQNNLRDIYVITLDEYLGTKSLMTKFNYDNSDFDNFLQERGFFIPENSFSNYMETRLALPSFLNMNYVNIDYESKREQDMVFQKITRNNLVMNNFKEIGYEIVYFHEENNLKPVESSENKLCSTFFNNNFLLFVLHDTPLVIFNNLTDPFNLQQYIENRLCIFDKLSSLDEEFSNPILVHAHIMLPHGPVIFDSVGNTIFEKDLHAAGPSKYTEQLQYANSKVKEVVENLQNQNPQPIIIIQSDHGYRWDFNWNDPTDDQFTIPYSNFIALYFPEKEISSEDFPLMTPVNIYRILFNTYFGTNYELLENKMYFRDNYYTEIEGIPSMRDITDTLISNNTSVIVQ